MDIKDLIKEKGVKNKLFDDWVSSASNALEVLGDSISKDDLKKILLTFLFHQLPDLLLDQQH